MKIKKVLAGILALCLMISMLVACGTEPVPSTNSGNQVQKSDSNAGNQKQKNSQKETEYKSAKEAYTKLAESHELCVEVMASIYDAWYFSIYKAEDYLSVQSCFDDFCAEANLNYNEALSALDATLKTMGYSNPTGMEQLAGLRVFSIAVAVVQKVYEDNGTYDKIDKNISEAKTSLKEVTDTYSDYTGYSTLKSYYSEVAAYTEFCKEPTGSFGQLKTTVDNYETNLRKFKNDLSFVFD